MTTLIPFFNIRPQDDCRSLKEVRDAFNTNKPFVTIPLDPRLRENGLIIHPFGLAPGLTVRVEYANGSKSTTITTKGRPHD